MMKLFKDNLDASIVLLNKDVYFDVAKKTVVFGNIDLKVYKSTKIKSFEVRIIGEANEMFYEQYKLKHAKSDLLKKKYKFTEILNQKYRFDISSLKPGTYKLPFELLINPQFETLHTEYMSFNYKLKLVIDTEAGRLVKYQPVSLIRLINIQELNYFGNFYVNLFSYQLNVPNKIFIDNDFKLQLLIGPNNHVKNLKIRRIEVFLMQNFKLNFYYYSINKAHKKDCKFSKFFEVNRFKLADLNPPPLKNNEKVPEEGDEDEAQLCFDNESLNFDLDLSLHNLQFNAHSTGKLIHPSVNSNILECFHQLRFVVYLNNGEHAKVVHSIEVHNSNSLNGSLAPPLYCTTSSDRSIDSTLLPPAYELAV